MIYDFIIIGGGISGLYILDNILTKYPHLTGRLLERSLKTGGQIKTEYDKNLNTLFEKGPWRIHHSHKHILELIKNLNLSLNVVSSSLPTSHKLTYDICKHQKYKTKKKPLRIKRKNKTSTSGISYRDNLISDTGICNYYEKSSFSRLPLTMDISSKPYDVNLQYRGKYYVVKEGFQEIINKLTNKYQEYIFFNSMVINIQKTLNEYKIVYQFRDKNTYYEKNIYCKNVFLCLPPHYTTNWDIVKNNLLPLVYAVDTMPLHHIYAQSKNIQEFYNNSFYINTNSQLTNIISGDFNNNWFQISYSGGENARYWNRLKLNNPKQFKQSLIKCLRRLNINIEINKIKSFYWEKAIHYWKPTYKFNLKECVKNSICPHPTNLPNLYWGCEAFSSKQGWIEGALLNCNMVMLKFIEHQKNIGRIFRPLKRTKHDDYVIIDNRYIDVSKWKYVHPGSYKAIQSHLKEDISKLFRQIKHSENSWAILYNLQKAWVNKEGSFVITT